jgi:branched-chain amino acid transport system permease protein
MTIYYISLALLLGVIWLLRNLERSRLGRAWIAIREDELAANCMGINTARAKLAAFALGSALAGLAGGIYASSLGNTSDPEAYGFPRSITTLCCLILGGLGSIRGALVGTLLLVGFDNVLAPAIDSWMQGSDAVVAVDAWLQRVIPNPDGKLWLSFVNWKLMTFGLALILMMRFRPEGLLPSRRIQLEVHSDPQQQPLGTA